MCSRMRWASGQVGQSAIRGRRQRWYATAHCSAPVSGRCRWCSRIVGSASARCLGLASGAGWVRGLVGMAGSRQRFLRLLEYSGPKCVWGRGNAVAPAVALALAVALTSSSSQKVERASQWPRISVRCRAGKLGQLQTAAGPFRLELGGCGVAGFRGWVCDVTPWRLVASSHVWRV